ncbi:hypothetical protein FKN08_18470 [Vibrio sp. 1-2 (7-a)]|nr:hypothetical protein [Vibrio sp. 1-2 (7-a)]
METSRSLVIRNLERIETKKPPVWAVFYQSNHNYYRTKIFWIAFIAIALRRINTLVLGNHFGV